MKDKISKYHRKATYYRARKAAIIIGVLMFLSAGIAVPVSLMAAEAHQKQTSSSSSEDNFIDQETTIHDILTYESN